MKGVRLFLVLGIAVLALAYLVFSPPDRANRKIPTADSVNDLVIGEPIVFRNLAIFPVSSKMLRNDDRFITLDEGLKAGTVEILERGAAPAAAAPDANDPFAPLATDPFAPVTANENSRVQQPAPAADPFADALPEGARRESELPAMPERRRSSGNSVNQLMVVNSSGKPLYLMPGEIVVGGSQDRAIGQELVVAPDKKAVPIDVFCVEHGRWGGRAPDTYARLLASTAGEGEPIAGFAANLSLSFAETAEVANAGKFVGSAGILNAHGRLAVQKDKDQQKVWDEVAKQNAKNSVETASGTFTANYSEADSIDRLTPFLEELLKPIDETDNVVGVIVAVNGQVASMDVFASTPLFRKLWPKLLK